MTIPLQCFWDNTVVKSKKYSKSQKSTLWPPVHLPEVEVPDRAAVAPVYHSVGSFLHIPKACSGVSGARQNEEGVWGKVGFVDGPVVSSKGDGFLRFCVSATDNVNCHSCITNCHFRVVFSPLLSYNIR